MNLRLALIVFTPFACASVASAQDKVDFARDIRPILSNHCFKCHGPAKQEAGLRLDDRDRATRRKIIVAGKPAASKLLERVQSDDADERMPPPDAGERLKPAQIELLKKWIAHGAEYSPHWAFVKPRQPPLPPLRKGGSLDHPDLTKGGSVDSPVRTKGSLHSPPLTKGGQGGWPRNPIDYFILARLEKEGLTPSPEADPATLIRRLSLDLTGLLPTPHEVDQFVREYEASAPRQAKDAVYQKLVDKLLASPHYG